MSRLAEVLALSLALLLTGCAATSREEAGMRRFEFRSPYMGALFAITLYARDEPGARGAADAAFATISRLEDIMSDYQADSELMELCQKPVGVPVGLSSDLFDVLEKSESLSRLTGGAFDVTIGPCVRLWRFSRKRKTLPNGEELANARACVGWRNLQLDPAKRSAVLLVPGMRLDLGGIAKGYAADRALETLNRMGCSRALVAASGDIAIGEPPPGQKGWRIGISGLEATPGYTGPILLLRKAGVSTSGDTEQSIEIAGARYSHILDPATGLGLTNRIQATVVAPNATLSDPLATAVCILGPEKGTKLMESLSGTATRIVWQDQAGATFERVSPRWPRFVQSGLAKPK